MFPSSQRARNPNNKQPRRYLLPVGIYSHNNEKAQNEGQHNSARYRSDRGSRATQQTSPTQNAGRYTVHLPSAGCLRPTRLKLSQQR
jgi:hypothetical protein